MIKESDVMVEIHKIRERFYLKTKDKPKAELLKLIKDQNRKVEDELRGIRPNPELIVKKKYKVPEPEAMREIHQIRERRAKYGRL